MKVSYLLKTAGLLLLTLSLFSCDGLWGEEEEEFIITPSVAAQYTTIIAGSGDVLLDSLDTLPDNASPFVLNSTDGTVVSEGSYTVDENGIMTVIYNNTVTGYPDSPYVSQFTGTMTGTIVVTPSAVLGQDPDLVITVQGSGTFDDPNVSTVSADLIVYITAATDSTEQIMAITGTVIIDNTEFDAATLPYSL